MLCCSEACDFSIIFLRWWKGNSPHQYTRPEEQVFILNEKARMAKPIILHANLKAKSNHHKHRVQLEPAFHSWVKHVSLAWKDTSPVIRQKASAASLSTTAVFNVETSSPKYHNSKCRHKCFLFLTQQRFSLANKQKNSQRRATPYLAQLAPRSRDCRRVAT